MDTKISTESTTSVFLSLSNLHNEVVTFSVKKERGMYNLDIYSKEPQSRKTLVQDIQLYLVLETSLLKKEPKDRLACLSNFISITQLYESVINMYK